jgi:hypothetical protein
MWWTSDKLGRQLKRSMVVGCCLSLNTALKPPLSDQKAITALSYSHQDSGTFFSGSYDGRVNSFASTGECTPVAGVGHANQVLALSGAGPGLVSVGMDDSVREIDVAAKSFK